jgi:hypothetical protein
LSIAKENKIEVNIKETFHDYFEGKHFSTCVYNICDSKYNLFKAEKETLGFLNA